ncbi:MAG: TetR/AcrR family transcriptional regulator [Clostridia bacterium]|jgi:AcrR family transcriptional regulator|nr:TetR/AcrR family transcriptional regulator [Clostridia bacterium]
MRKTEIIGESLKQFMNKGYDGTSLSDIASACGITKAALYHHFKNKDDLFVSAVEYYYANNNENSSPLFNKDLDLDGVVEVTAKLISQYMTNELIISGEVPNQFKLIFDAFRFDTCRVLLGGHYSSVYRLFKSKVEEAIANGNTREGLDADIVTMALINVTQGIKLNRTLMINDNELNEEVIIKQLESIYK